MVTPVTKSASDDARKAINGWAAEKTHDKIPELLAKGTVDAKTRVAKLTVRAPSTAFVTRTVDDLAGPGLRQLGVVEYRCEPGDVGVFFRSIPTLTEGGALASEQLLATAAEIGVSMTPVSSGASQAMA